MLQRSEIALSVLPEKQQGLKPLLEEFSSTHFLVGGTASSLRIGHRRSIDYDLFSFGSQGSGKELMQRIQDAGFTPDPKTNTIKWLSTEEQSEATCFIDGVKIQFVDFSRNPFDVEIPAPSPVFLEKTIRSCSILDLGAMKVYAMMYRKKWKDAVDLYMLRHTLDEGAPYTLAHFIERAQSRFTSLYQPKATLETLLADERDMTEKVDRLVDFPPEEETIKNYLRMDVEEYLIGLD